MDPSTRSAKKEFSPFVAIALSLPLLMMLALIFGPDLWDRAAAMLGVKVPNAPAMIRQRLPIVLIYPAFIYPAFFVAIYVCSRLAVTYCGKTQGHNLLRISLRMLHFIVTLLIYVVLAVIVLALFAFPFLFSTLRPNGD